MRFSFRSNTFFVALSGVRSRLQANRRDKIVGAHSHVLIPLYKPNSLRDSNKTDRQQRQPDLGQKERFGSQISAPHGTRWGKCGLESSLMNAVVVCEGRACQGAARLQSDSAPQLRAAVTGCSVDQIVLHQSGNPFRSICTVRMWASYTHNRHLDSAMTKAT
jgi:hypothetical protein